ncbi:MAG: tetratricopeptide repeat protein [Verrucomicrobia bacterium]|nr:tetratricopeptide repeat protein [Verrucomicrobiota bacterium]
MEIITFFSFKGGVGRTQALLNTACEFAQRGRKVLMLDFDLQAPGLSLMECMRPLEPLTEARPGVLDFFEWLVLLDDAVRQGQPPPAPVNLAACAYETTLTKQLREGSGFLKIVPARPFSGTPDEAADYSDRVHAIDSPLTQAIGRTHHHGRRNPLIEQIRAQCSALPADQQPDAIFIDARTGITGIADLLLTRSSDRIVAVAGLNQQNLWGLEATLQDIQRAVTTPDWLRRLTLVISPVPQGELQLTTERIKAITSLLESHIDPTEREMFGPIGLLPDPVRVPYDAQLALVEDPILLRHEDSGPSKAYKILADQLGAKAEPLQFQEPGKERIPMGRGDDLPQEHPLSRVLPWNAGLTQEQSARILRQLTPANSPDKPYQDWLIHLLNYMANSLLGMDPKVWPFSGLLTQLPRVDLPGRVTLLEAMRGPRQYLLSRPRSEWSHLSRIFGESRVVSELEIGKWLGIEFAPWETLTSGHCSASLWGGYWTGMADALRMRGDRDEALSILLLGADHFKGRPDFAANATHSLLMVDAYLDALSVANAWANYASSHAHPSLVQALVRKGDVLKLLDRLDDARNILAKAEQVARDNPADKAGLASTLQALGDLLARTDKLDDARARYDEALAICREIKARVGEANTLQALGDLLVRTAKPDDARNCLKEAEDIYLTLEEDLGLANTRQTCAKLHLAMGDLDGGQTLIDECLKRYTVLNNSEGRWETLMVSARLDATRGAHQMALATANQVAREAGASGHLLLAREAETLAAGWTQETGDRRESCV